MRALVSVSLSFAVVVACASCGCKHAAEAQPAASAPASTTAASAAPVATGAVPATSGGEQPLAPEALHGSWVEYWALSGRAETQRYTFMPDGRFGWCAGPSTATPARRWGRFSVAGDALVLNVQGEDAQRECDGTGGCRALHEPALEQRLPLGACPPNEEARALDTQYRCVSVGGQAFWLGPASAASDADAAALAK
jgi:hypothetical protein